MKGVDIKWYPEAIFTQQTRISNWIEITKLTFFVVPLDKNITVHPERSTVHIPVSKANCNSRALPPQPHTPTVDRKTDPVAKPEKGTNKTGAVKRRKGKSGKKGERSDQRVWVLTKFQNKLYLLYSTILLYYTIVLYTYYSTYLSSMYA